MNLTPDLVAQITDYLDASTPLPDRADLIFVFGTRLLTPAYIAVELYRQQRAPYIVLTGGSNRHTGVYEVEGMYAVLMDQGISSDAIVLETCSTNTFENVTFAIPEIEQKLALASVRSVLAVCKWMHSRRALMTLKRHFPCGVRYYAHTYAPEGITRENWHIQTISEIANVLKNWERIPEYIQRGHIEEIVRDGDAYM
ncbi:MAG: YdcF family protein [Anaerolineae bacterium]|nr:YdcF family protein [Anaerolineae bacterium]